MISYDINLNETSHWLDCILQSATRGSPRVAEINIFGVPEDLLYARYPHCQIFDWTFLETHLQQVLSYKNKFMQKSISLCVETNSRPRTALL